MVIEYIKINPPLATSDYENLLQQLPEKLRQKNLKYRKYPDRLRNLFGLLISKRQLTRFDNQEFDLNQLERTPFNRPYLPKRALDFNISHAGEYVVGVFTEKAKVGIDIELKRQVDFKDFKRTMNQDQWRVIYESDDPFRTFYQFWCMKESVIKADGRGLSIPLTEIILNQKTITCPGSSWHIEPFQLDEDHLGCVASDQLIDKVELKPVDWEQLKEEFLSLKEHIKQIPG